MKKIESFLICLFIASSVFGQDAVKAKQLLDDVSKKVQGYKNIALDFQYVLNNTEEDIKQETTGNVILQGEKYLLNFMGITKLFDLKKEYTIVPENEEITIAAPEANEGNVITPSKMLTFYENGYNYSWDIMKNIKGRKIQFIKLTPIDSNAEISQIMLGIDVQTKHIYSLIQSDGSSTTTTLTVISFKTDQPLSESLFTFDANKYKDYYINN